MGYAQTTTACVNAPSRKLFAPMFKARWQNMQNIVNDSAFLSMIPEPYLSYYTAFIRQCIQWARGFVPMLHQRDFFSTGMGETVCEIIARECMSGGYRLESIDESVQAFMEEWKTRTRFTDLLYKAFWNSAAGGNALLTVTPIGGEIYATAYPIDRCIFQINRREEVVSCLILNRFTAGETAFYTKEHRRTLNGKGFYKVELAKGTLVTAPTWQGDTFKEVPAVIEDSFRDSYGDIGLGEWYELPEGISGCGVYNVRNKALAVALADMPGYSDSSLYTALDILYSIDFNYTQAQVDMYKGKSIVLIPKQMGSGVINTGRVDTVSGVSFREALQQTPLADDFYTEVMTATGEPIKPTFVQADLRGEAHKFIRDADLELLASKVGLSSSTLANHLTYNTSKTATEVRSEQDTTESTVRSKRDLARVPLEQLLTDVARFYGFKNAKVEINFGRAGVNSSTENAELLSDYNAGVLPLEQYLRKRWNDLSTDEISAWIKQLDEERRKRNEGGGMEKLFDDKDYYGSEKEEGDGVNE